MCKCQTSSSKTCVKLAKGSKRGDTGHTFDMSPSVSRGGCRGGGSRGKQWKSRGGQSKKGKQ